jgi:hypothetical protein
MRWRFSPSGYLGPALLAPVMRIFCRVFVGIVVRGYTQPNTWNRAIVTLTKPSMREGPVAASGGESMKAAADREGGFHFSAAAFIRLVWSKRHALPRRFPSTCQRAP